MKSNDKNVSSILVTNKFNVDFFCLTMTINRLYTQ